MVAIPAFAGVRERFPAESGVFAMPAEPGGQLRLPQGLLQLRDNAVQLLQQLQADRGLQAVWKGLH